MGFREYLDDSKIFLGGLAMYNNTSPVTDGQMSKTRFDAYFIATGFLDLLPLALNLAAQLSYCEAEIVEAICKVADKFREYPPTKNRNAWFAKVFTEKLAEARADISKRDYCRNL